MAIADAGACRTCGGVRSADGPCPHCGDLPEPAWPSSADARDPAAATWSPPSPPGGSPPGPPSVPPGSPPPPPPGVAPAGARGAFQPPPAPSSSGSGCRRAAIIAAIVAVLVVVLVVVAVVLGFRSLRDGGFGLDVDDDGGISFSDASTHGDDQALDELWDDCADEDYDACDDLFFQAPFLSDYEAFGDTCGRRRDEGLDTLCVQDFGRATGVDAQAQDYGDDEALDALWDSCEAGDLAACDELYFVSAVGSDYERFGATCGDREDDEIGGTCDPTGLPDEPMEYGQDPVLDDLYDACAAGDLASCDRLYVESPFDSEYESFAQTCGGTREAGGRCDES